MKKSILFWPVVIMSLLAAPVFAGKGQPVTMYSLISSGGGTKSQTAAYVGLNWSLDGGVTPSMVLGVFHVQTKSNGDTHGENLNFSFNIAEGLELDKLKLGYLQGKRDYQGELAIGYGVLKGAPLVGLGVNARHATIGVDGYLGSAPSLDPFVTIHTQGEFDKRKRRQRCVEDPAGPYQNPDCTNPGGG
ncbi:MAG: hypothetical protein H7A11_07530 [Pseudomonadales bacterium]|nr:hypothetical protein [Pseudomonadales bacterium]